MSNGMERWRMQRMGTVWQTWEVLGGVWIGVANGHGTDRKGKPWHGSARLMGKVVTGLAMLGRARFGILNY